MECRYCKGVCIKKGKSKGIQKFQCKVCNRKQQETYAKEPISQEKYEWVRNLTKEGNSISSISRLLHISKSSVQRVIERIAEQTVFNPEKENQQEYEIDEMKVVCKQKKTKSGSVMPSTKTQTKL